MIFSIYYINFPKAYEIKMMLGNIIKTSREECKEDSTSECAELKAKFGLQFLNFFNASVDGSQRAQESDSKKVLETFEVKTTKSIILNDIIERSTMVSSFSDGRIGEGQLILINDISLSLENETELRTIKFINSGAFKNFVVPGANGIDMNSLFNSMFKDYAYKIKGVINDADENILVKIPISFENEFESQYGVDDIFIGKVSILGLYKGLVKKGDLKNSFEFFQEIGNVQNQLPQNRTTEYDEIQDSQYPRDAVSNKSKYHDEDSGNYHYIDLIAIIQNVDDGTAR